MDEIAYREFGSALLTGNWDPPIYLDALEHSHFDDLFRGWELEDLLGNLPEDVKRNGDTFYGMLCPIMNTFMIASLQGLSFRVGVEAAQQDKPLPHVDLTKLLWLMHAYAPIWADLGFFCEVFLAGAGEVSGAQLLQNLSGKVPDKENGQNGSVNTVFVETHQAQFV